MLPAGPSRETAGPPLTACAARARPAPGRFTRAPDGPQQRQAIARREVGDPKDPVAAPRTRHGVQGGAAMCASRWRMVGDGPRLLSPAPETETPTHRAAPPSASCCCSRQEHLGGVERGVSEGVGVGCERWRRLPGTGPNDWPFFFFFFFSPYPYPLPLFLSPELVVQYSESYCDDGRSLGSMLACACRVVVVSVKDKGRSETSEGHVSAHSSHPSSSPARRPLDTHKKQKPAQKTRHVLPTHEPGHSWRRHQPGAGPGAAAAARRRRRHDGRRRRRHQGRGAVCAVSGRPPRG